MKMGVKVLEKIRLQPIDLTSSSKFKGMLLAQ